jgi:hypothetical protein
MLLTSGDSMSELAEHEGLGVVAAPRAVDQAADGIRRLLEDDAFRDRCRKAVQDVAGRFTWTEVCRPLLDFCRAPYRSPDAMRRTAAANPGLGARQPRRELLLRKAWLSFRTDGVGPFASRTYRYLRRRLT